MKKNIANNFGELLNPNPAKAQGAESDAQPHRKKGDYRTVCYSIPPKTAEKMRKIASWERKKINAVVTEAFEQYAARWVPSKSEPPTL